MIDIKSIFTVPGDMMRMGKRDFSDDMRFGKRGKKFTIQGHRNV